MSQHTFDELPSDDPPLVAAFREFHAANPHVYELFKRFAFEVIARGHRHYSARAVWYRLRWHVQFETSDPDFKLNDHHTPYYARMFMREFPRHEGFFETRRVQSEGTERVA